MHLRKTNLGGQRPAPVPALGDQELPAEETVLRVSLRLSDRKRDWIQRGTGNVSLKAIARGRTWLQELLSGLSDRKRDWIQRGTGNVSLPGLPGGGGSRRRTRLLTGIWQNREI